MPTCSSEVDGNPTINAEASMPDKVTLQDLLDEIRNRLSAEPFRSAKQVKKRMGDFITLANRIARYLNKPINCISIREVAELRSAFSLYLQSTAKTRSTAYKTTVTTNTLLRYVREFGWAPSTFTLAEEWKPALDALKGVRGGPAIAKHAIAQDIPVAAFSQRHISEWQAEKEKAGKTPPYTSRAESGFLKAIRAADLTDLFPKLDFSPRTLPPYSIAVKEMPDSLRQEIEEILAWMHDPSNHLPQDRYRETSVTQAKEDFEYLVGYAMLMRPKYPVTCLLDLLNEQFFAKYLEWMHDTRGLKRATIAGRLSRLHTVLFRYPKYARDDGNDYAWMLRLLKTLPVEGRSAIEARRREKEDLYSEIFKIPDLMHSARLTTSGLSAKTLAWMAHDELLVAWAIYTLWFPRCIRECRVGLPGGNLFQSAIAENTSDDEVPPWAVEARNNGQTLFWQYRFQRSETPFDKEIYGFLPRILLPRLTEYISIHRRLLVNEHEQETLFLSRRSRGALTDSLLNQRLGTLTLKYFGKRLTVTSIRASFAYDYLAKNPAGFAALAAMLGIDYATAKLRYGKKKSHNWR